MQNNNVFPISSANQAVLARMDQIDDCMNSISSIIKCLHATVEGERNMTARDWLVTQLDDHHRTLEELLGIQNAG